MAMRLLVCCLLVLLGQAFAQEGDFTNRWRLSANYLTYQEQAVLKDSAGRENLYSAQQGWCVGGQWARGNLEQEWSIDACAFATQGNVGAENSARYFQKDVSSRGLFLKPTWWKVLSEGEAAFGIGMPIMFNHVDYSEPSGTTISRRTTVPVGLSVDGRWAFQPERYFTTTAGWFGQSLLWTLGVSWGL